MKKLLIFSIYAFISTVYIAFGAEHKQYGTTMSEDLYFISWSNVTQTSSVTYTNKEIEMWYPAKIKIYNTSAIGSTGTLDHITVISNSHYPPNTVTTNESGTVSTNYWKGAITNTTYTYLTNRLCTITNSASFNLAEFSSDQYIQKGDIIVWNFSQTNDVWFGIVAHR